MCSATCIIVWMGDLMSEQTGGKDWGEGIWLFNNESLKMWLLSFDGVILIDIRTNRVVGLGRGKPGIQGDVSFTSHSIFV
jgi:hypothetical protein